MNRIEVTINNKTFGLTAEQLEELNSLLDGAVYKKAYSKDFISARGVSIVAVNTTRWNDSND